MSWNSIYSSHLSGHQSLPPEHADPQTEETDQDSLLMYLNKTKTESTSNSSEKVATKATGDNFQSGSNSDHPLSEFFNETSQVNYAAISQGNRPCPGKRQRRGVTGRLMCHKIDLQQLHYLNVLSLATYLNPDSEILGRKSTGLCAKCQRQVRIFELQF